jgi:hypothetical protein
VIVTVSAGARASQQVDRDAGGQDYTPRHEPMLTGSEAHGRNQSSIWQWHEM